MFEKRAAYFAFIVGGVRVGFKGVEHSVEKIVSFGDGLLLVSVAGEEVANAARLDALSFLTTFAAPSALMRWRSLSISAAHFELFA